MKFLNIYCENRQAEVYISLDKIVLVQKLDEETSLLELEGDKQTVNVKMAADTLVRKINGEDKVTIGFRAGR
ncbi:MAG TPA: hypothetical protein VGN63_13965 [Flavisolibacter sp.]|jgi:hypothetical protein|nr:hypothetical protein [Flavisolibacter sp.]